jgi:hypothetical protein
MSKPIGPGVTRANLVLVWHKVQSGRRMFMMLSPLVQAGALQNSQSPVDTEGDGDGASMGPLKFYRCSILLIFEKLMTRSALADGASARCGLA